MWNSILKNHVYSNADERNQTAIHVRSPSDCVMSFFDRTANVASTVVKEVQQLDGFITETQSVNKLKQKLVQCLPELSM